MFRVRRSRNESGEEKKEEGEGERSRRKKKEKVTLKKKAGEGNQIQEEKMFNFHFSCPFDPVFACYLVRSFWVSLSLPLSFPFLRFLSPSLTLST